MWLGGCSCVAIEASNVVTLGRDEMRMSQVLSRGSLKCIGNLKYAKGSR